MREYLYIELWKKHLPLLLAASQQSIQMERSSFEAVGNRKKSGYGFNIRYIDGQEQTSNGGSAVARDLKTVISESVEWREVLSDGHFKIAMGKDFILKIQKL
jgi:hypothetical protein